MVSGATAVPRFASEAERAGCGICGEAAWKGPALAGGRRLRLCPGCAQIWCRVDRQRANGGSLFSGFVNSGNCRFYNLIWAHEFKRFEAILRQAPGARALDVGCGAGAFSRRLRGRWETYATDLHKAAVDGGSLPEDHFHLGALASAPWPADFFGAITFFDCLYYFEDPVADLRKAWALLQPGGVVLITVPSLPHWLARNAGPFGKALTGSWLGQFQDPKIASVFSSRAMRRALGEAGFESIVARAGRGPVGGPLRRALSWFEFAAGYAVDKLTRGRWMAGPTAIYTARKKASL